MTSQLYTDDSILLGYVYTDEAIQNSAEFPTVAIESGFEKNPQMIMWDPATYPDVETIADLGKTGMPSCATSVARRGWSTSPAQGILIKDKVDGSYSGDPSLFIADEGKAAQQGFGSAEPYLYENVYADWMKPVKYQYINDAGWNNYAESIATQAGEHHRVRRLLQGAGADHPAVERRLPRRSGRCQQDHHRSRRRVRQRLGVRPGRR